MIPTAKDSSRSPFLLTPEQARAIVGPPKAPGPKSFVTHPSFPGKGKVVDEGVDADGVPYYDVLHTFNERARVPQHDASPHH